MDIGTLTIPKTCSKLTTKTADYANDVSPVSLLLTLKRFITSLTLL